MDTKASVQKPIIFFDDDCRMCNTFVNLILRVDKKQIFRFAPLQGATARELLPPQAENPREWSMIYVDELGIYDQSDASLEVYRRLGGAWTLLSLMRFVPRFLRNPLYRIIARNRYRWFGQGKSCRVHTPAEQARFLT